MVLKKDLVNAPGLICSPPVKEKKKGIFSSVMKDSKSAKARNGHEVETEDCRQSIEELSTIFSTSNFSMDVESEERKVMNEEDEDLDIGISFFLSYVVVLQSRLHFTSLLMVRQMTLRSTTRKRSQEGIQ